VHAFGVKEAADRLREAGGGYEVVYESPSTELGVYVLCAPEPDRQQPHEDDEVYVVLEGSGTLDVEGERVEMKEGDAVFVPAGADHRFVAYEQLALIVIFERRR
jgi:mannose-6-phosphate isomerase-like protein (cupin superfamily)